MQAEIGWDSTKMVHPFPSVSVLTQAVITVRLANPYMVQKHGWSTEYDEVKAEILQYLALLCLRQGAMNFINTDESAPPQPEMTQKKTLYQNVVGIKTVSAGIGVLLDWLGSGGVPVSAEVAERRANICKDCPKNDGGDFKAYFTEPIAAKIKQQLEIKHDLQLKTSVDDNLTVCSACDCPLPLKVWTPLEHILVHTSKEVKAKLHPKCWILHEA